MAGVHPGGTCSLPVQVWRTLQRDSARQGGERYGEGKAGALHAELGQRNKIRDLFTGVSR